MEEERQRTISDHDPCVDAVSPEQSGGADRSLQTQDWLPVETHCEKNTVANILLQFAARTILRNALASQLPQNVPDAAE
jgi:hypothetical protein